MYCAILRSRNYSAQSWDSENAQILRLRGTYTQVCDSHTNMVFVYVSTIPVPSLLYLLYADTESELCEDSVLPCNCSRDLWYIRIWDTKNGTSPVHARSDKITVLMYWFQTLLSVPVQKLILYQQKPKTPPLLYLSQYIATLITFSDAPEC